MIRSRRLRAILALLVLLGGGVFDAERVVGELRDGQVHHETISEAAAHAERTSGDHGHEDGTSSHADHGPGHSHGTSADHCTHQHGTPVPCAFQFALAFTIGATSFGDELTLTPISTTTFLRPPSLG